MSQEVYRIRLINSKEIELPYDPGIPLFGVYPKEKKKKNANSKIYMQHYLQ